MLTYEAPKQSPSALKEEDNGDSNIQVGTVGISGLEAGGQVLVQPNSGTHREGWHGKRSCWESLGTGATRGLAVSCMQ